MTRRLSDFLRLGAALGAVVGRLSIRDHPGRGFSPTDEPAGLMAGTKFIDVAVMSPWREMGRASLYVEA